MMSGDGQSGGIRMGRMGPGMSQGMQYQQSPHSRQRKKAPAVNHTLHVNLEELYTGTVKRMRITRRRIDAQGATVKVAAEKEITVKAGWKDGTKITFENEGDDNQDMLPADVVFTLQTRPHAIFQRQDDDLIYTVRQWLFLRMIILNLDTAFSFLIVFTFPLCNNRLIHSVQCISKTHYAGCTQRLQPLTIDS